MTSRKGNACSVALASCCSGEQCNNATVQQCNYDSHCYIVMTRSIVTRVSSDLRSQLRTRNAQYTSVYETIPNTCLDTSPIPRNHLGSCPFGAVHNTNGHIPSDTVFDKNSQTNLPPNSCQHPAPETVRGPRIIRHLTGRGPYVSPAPFLMMNGGGTFVRPNATHDQIDRFLRVAWTLLRLPSWLQPVANERMRNHTFSHSSIGDEMPSIP